MIKVICEGANSSRMVNDEGLEKIKGGYGGVGNGIDQPIDGCGCCFCSPKKGNGSDYTATHKSNQGG